MSRLMRKRAGWKGAVLIAFGVLTALPVAARAATINVPPGGDGFARALANASPGDTVFLESGLHFGPVVIDKTLVVTGSPAAIVDGRGRGNVITISAPKAIVRDLHVRNSGIRLDKMDSGIYLDDRADGALVEGNVLSGNLFGIYVQGPDGALVRGNTVTGRRDLRVNERGNGVSIWNSPGSIIEGNKFRYGRDGIFSNTSRNNIFRNNEFRDLRFAVHYMYTNQSEISGNLSVGNDVGYALMFSEGMKVTGNVSLNDRNHGFLLNYANRSTITANRVENGRGKCVFIYNSNGNLFQGNRFEGCAIGVHFTGGSERNTITGNAFINNRTQVKYVGTRWLEWSKNGRGNYWSDNSAFDLDGDGIADAAYRPNDLVDQIVWRAPAAKILLSSPAVQLLRWAQSQFPGLYPGGVIDSAPLMKAEMVKGNGQ